MVASNTCIGMCSEAFKVYMELTQSVISTRTQGKTCYEFVRFLTEQVRFVQLQSNTDHSVLRRRDWKQVSSTLLLIY